LAWGEKLAGVSSPGVAAEIINGGVEGLEADEKVLADWARKLARDPNAVTEADVDALREAGFDDRQIFAITTFVALRLAFATVNDALGANPDRELYDSTPSEVRSAVTFGRRPDGTQEGT
jgi:alkylhydroperoxidase family enzyme